MTYVIYGTGGIMQENEIQIRVQHELAKILENPRIAMTLYAKALLESESIIGKAKEEITALTNRIESELAPKVQMYEITMGSESLHEMSAVAKILNFRNMGRNNIFEYLKSKSILRYNKEPYQKYVDAGYFKIIEQSYDKGYGTQINRKTMVTQKGIDYIGRMMKNDGYEPNAR